MIFAWLLLIVGNGFADLSFHLPVGQQLAVACISSGLLWGIDWKARHEP